MDEKGKKEVNAREFFRISYRRAPGPVFEYKKVKFLILDLSEGGLKFAMKKDMVFHEKSTIEGRLIFPNERGVLELKGVVIRVTSNEVAIRFPEDGRVPLSRIMEEQRYLIQQGRL